MLYIYGLYVDISYILNGSERFVEPIVLQHASSGVQGQ